MKGNLDSLRSGPELTSPMTPREMERQLVHLAAKVRELEAQAKWFITRDGTQRLILRTLKGESRRGTNQHDKPKLCPLGCGMEGKHRTEKQCVAALRRSLIALQRNNAALRKESLR